MKNASEIGQIVRRLRGDLSLRDFAQRCDISHTTLDNIEKGKDFRTGKPTNASATILNKIASAAGVPLSYIIEDDNDNDLSINKQLLLSLIEEMSEEQQELLINIAKTIKK